MKRCAGHGFALSLLASLLKNHRLSLADFLKDPEYEEFWKREIVRKLYKGIEQLDQDQWKLLLALSTYREFIPLAGVRELMKRNIRIPGTKTEIFSDLQELLDYHLLQVQKGRYKVHPIATIVIDYLQRHPDEHDKQIGQRVLRAFHTRAAQYCLNQGNDIRPLIKAVWHRGQIRQWSKAYALLQKKPTFPDPQTWGDRETLRKFTATVRETCELLLSSSKWQLTSPKANRIRSYQDTIYRELENV